MAETYDVLIVGARVAGSILAALLGDAGYRVLIVDRDAFPSNTVSTHFFRWEGLVAVLKRLGVYEQVMALGSPKLVRSYWWQPGSLTPDVQPKPDPEVHDLSVRREPLDHLLLQRARQSGNVTLRERTRVIDLLWEGDRVTGARLQGEGATEDVYARFVVGADGRNSFVAKAVGAPEEEGEEGHRAGYYWYVRNFPGPSGTPDGPEFSIQDDEMFYVFPSDGGVSCLALTVSLAAFARTKEAPAERWEELLSRHVGLYPRWQASTREGNIYGCGPFRNVVRVPTGPGWALVGDAGMVQDFWAGLGMDFASTHATYLADALLAVLGGAPEAEALAEYHRRRNEHGLQLWRETVVGSRNLNQPAEGH